MEREAFIFTIFFLTLGPVKIIPAFAKLTHSMTAKFKKSAVVRSTQAIVTTQTAFVTTSVAVVTTELSVVRTKLSVVTTEQAIVTTGNVEATSAVIVSGILLGIVIVEKITIAHCCFNS